MKSSQNQRVLAILAAILITTTNLVISASAQPCTCWPYFCAGEAELCFNLCDAEHEGCDFCWGWDSWCTECTMWAKCGSAWECWCIDHYYFRNTCYENTGDCWP